MKNHLRIAALQCNFQSEEQTLAMPDFWAKNGFNTEQLLHTHADLYSAIYDPARHQHIMREYLKRSKDNGIGTIVYMNCHILGPSLTNHFEDWCIRHEDNSTTKLYNTYPAACLNSGWRDYFFQCIESLGEFDIEGIFFDGPAYNDCYCPACQKRFLEATGKPMSQATKEEIHEFTMASVLEFKQTLRKKVKSVNPNWVMYFNEGLYSGHHDKAVMKDHLLTNDLVGTEGGFFFYDKPRTLPYWRCGVYAKIAESTAQGRPSVIFFAADHKPWGWYLHTPTELRLCYADAIGNGASVWLGIHSNPDNYRTNGGEAVMEMVKFDAQNDACYQNTTSVAECAVFYSYNTAAHSNNCPEESDFYGKGSQDETKLGNYHDEVNGAFAALEHLNIAYDVVTDLNPKDILKYKLLLVPNATCLDEETLDALKTFVEQGGTLLADGVFARADGNGIPRTTRPAWIGAEVTPGVFDQKRFNYMSLKWEGFEADNAFGYQPSPSWMFRVEPTADAEVIARIPVPLEGCYAAKPGIPKIPVGIRNRVGKGVFCLVAGGLFEFYRGFEHTAIRRWFKAIVDSVGLTARLENALPGISMTLRKTQDGKLLVHLTNHIGATRPLDGIPALANTTLVLPSQWKHATTLMGNDGIKALGDGRFALPPLQDVTILLFDE